MAITRLTDIITVFDSKWTYGDVKFGYEGEVNQDHDTKYPLMLVEPPSSIIPKIYDGREEYEFEVNFYNLYPQAAQSVVTLQKRWDNLQDLANEWLDMVLKYYQDSVFTTNVEAYLNDESIEIERVKEVANDRLVQIKLTFTMSGFTKCFRPVSNYPSDYSDLKVWLKSDSGATFDIASKRVSAWADQSGNSNDVAQSTAANQPLRYGYGGVNDKSYFDFDGTNDSFVSGSNLPLTNNFTIFEVSKIINADGIVFEYSRNNTSIKIGLNTTKELSVNISDSVSRVITTRTGADNSKLYHIGIVKKESQAVNLEYYDSSTSSLTSNINATFNGSQQFNANLFNIGNKGTDFLDGQLNELIIFNRALTDIEIANVRGYLNTKYKIY
jgi:archaellum component FlaF (FlaF/FlaG flagellin family)